MKLNGVMTLISAAMSALIGYGFYTANRNEGFVLLVSLVIGFLSFATLAPLLALRSERRGITGNVRALSAVFFVLFLIVHLVFTFTAIHRAPYIITNGILFLVYASVFYAISKK